MLIRYQGSSVSGAEDPGRHPGCGAASLQYRDGVENGVENEHSRELSWKANISGRDWGALNYTRVQHVLGKV